jgi:hypothetical protein
MLISIHFRILLSNRMKVVLVGASFTARTHQRRNGAPVYSSTLSSTEKKRRKRFVRDLKRRRKEEREIDYRPILRRVQSLARCVVSPHNLHEPPFGYTPLPLFCGHELARWPLPEHTKHDT